jgi:hypothetical protein
MPGCLPWRSPTTQPELEMPADVYENGIISTVNELATELGAVPGMSVRDYVALIKSANSTS